MLTQGHDLRRVRIQPLPHTHEQSSLVSDIPRDGLTPPSRTGPAAYVYGQDVQVESIEMSFAFSALLTDRAYFDFAATQRFAYRQ